MIAPDSEHVAAQEDLKTYFILDPASRRVKIGKTRRHPEARLRDFQTGSGAELVLLGHLPGDRERDLHRLFRTDRSHREWFNLSPPVADFIAQQFGTDLRHWGMPHAPGTVMGEVLSSIEASAGGKLRLASEPGDHYWAMEDWCDSVLSCAEARLRAEIHDAAPSDFRQGEIPFDAPGDRPSMESEVSEGVVWIADFLDDWQGLLIGWMLRQDQPTLTSRLHVVFWKPNEPAISGFMDDLADVAWRVHQDTDGIAELNLVLVDRSTYARDAVPFTDLEDHALLRSMGWTPDSAAGCAG